MKNRFKEFVFEKEDGVQFFARALDNEIFELSEGEDGELIIKSIPSNTKRKKPPMISSKKYADVLSLYQDDAGNIAVVPPGWTVSGVTKENTIFGKNVSLVIYRIPKEEVNNINWDDENELETLKKKYSQFVWVPVNLLDFDGTLDGEIFSEKLGRRNYYKDDKFSPEEYNEPLKGILLEQLASTERYNGFYFSRYTISKSSNGKPISVKGQKPWIKVSFNEAKELAAIIERNDEVKSHLPYGAEYDSVLAWFLKTNARTLEELNVDSTNWGNYWNSKDSFKNIALTGSNENWSTNNIYDLAGNTDEWTQEMKSKIYRVSRGGSYDFDGYCLPVAYRSINKLHGSDNETGFRAVLYIK